MHLRYERKAPQPTEFAESTKLIWHGAELETYYDTPKNACCLFRKTFELAREPKGATVRLFADSRYVLYINGVQVGRGPCRSDPRWQYYDTYEVSGLLKEGINIIAAKVMYYGYGTGKSIHRIPALFLQLDAQFNGDSSLTIGTDESFKVLRSKAFIREVPRINGCKGCMEVFDNRYAEEGFIRADYDDSAWDNAKTRDVKLSPFWNLYPRPVSNLSEKLTPAKAVVAGGMGNAAKGFDLEHLHFAVQKEMRDLKATHMYVTETAGEFPPVENDMFSCVIADFGKVRAGYIVLDITGYGGDVVDVVYAEELYDGKPDFDGVSYRPVSRFILKDGENHLETLFNYEAFRYAAIIFRNHIRKDALNGVFIKEQYYPIENESVFETDNEKLQKIWDISVRTLKLCMQDGFLDSPSREQQQWMGDGRFQAIMNYYLTGDSRMHEKLLLQIAQSQDEEGMTCSRYPDENHNLPPIPSFCLQWICSFGDLYDFTGKTDLIEKLWNSILSAMRWFSGYENGDGLLENVPYWQYYDMSKSAGGKNADFYRGGINGLINMMYIEAMDTVVRLSEVIGDMETERFFRAKSKKMKKSVKAALWNEEKGAYCDCAVAGEQSESVSEAVNAMAILVLYNKDDKHISRIVQNVFDAETRMKEVCRVSPYFMLPFYRALKKAGRNDIALTETEARYGKMVEHGATTTWEHWELTEQNECGTFHHSACHAWAAAPIVFAAENLLGIDGEVKKGATKPEPHASGNIEAKFITPRGVFDIKIEDGKVKRNTLL